MSSIISASLRLIQFSIKVLKHMHICRLEKTLILTPSSFTSFSGTESQNFISDATHPRLSPLFVNFRKIIKFEMWNVDSHSRALWSNQCGQHIAAENLVLGYARVEDTSTYPDLRTTFIFLPMVITGIKQLSGHACFFLPCVALVVKGFLCWSSIGAFSCNNLLPYITKYKISVINK